MAESDLPRSPLSALAFGRAAAIAGSNPSRSDVSAAARSAGTSPTLLEALALCGKHGFLRRVRASPLANLFSDEPRGDVLVSTFSDGAVSTFALVSTLLLTCPFALLGSLQPGAWDVFSAALLTCSANPYTGATPWGPAEVNAYVKEWVSPNVNGGVMAAVYLGLTTILLAVVYYTVRPPVLEERGVADFIAWWRRGRWLVLANFICMAATTVAVLVFANTYHTNFLTPTAEICTVYNKRYHSYIGASATIAAIIFAAFFLTV